MQDHVFKGQVPRCNEDGCDGTVKPDIVFFGEALPSAFGANTHQTTMADLVLILGTSLTVYPFAGLPEMAREGKPRVLFNMERVGQLGRRADDVMELGSCDDGIRKLADELGWREELEAYWRSVVGHEEAERQLRSAEERGDEVEDEVQKLTAGVESALRLDDDDESDDEAGPARNEGSRTDELTEPAEETTAKEVLSKDHTVGEDESAMAAASHQGIDKEAEKEPERTPVEKESAADAAILKQDNDEQKEEANKPAL
jgi:NAD-dependent histone deacetylase SIR2